MTRPQEVPTPNEMIGNQYGDRAKDPANDNGADDVPELTGAMSVQNGALVFLIS